MEKSFLLSLAVTFFLVIVSSSHGNAREISYPEVWSGDQFLQYELYKPNKPKTPETDYAIATSNDDRNSIEADYAVTALKEALERVKEQSKSGKQQIPKDLIQDIFCLIFGCNSGGLPASVLNITTTTSVPTEATTQSTTTQSTTRATVTQTTTTATVTQTPTTADPRNCSTIQIILGLCTSSGGVDLGNNGGSSGGNGPGFGGGSFEGGSFGSGFTSNLADSYNMSSIVRTRRPTKYKIGKNCKNKPLKHSKEIEDEDKADNDGNGGNGWNGGNSGNGGNGWNGGWHKVLQKLIKENDQ